MYLTNASISALFRRIELFAALSGLFFAHNSLKINCFHHWDGLYLSLVALSVSRISGADFGEKDGASLYPTCERLSLKEYMQRVVEYNESVQGRLLGFHAARHLRMAELGTFEPALVASGEYVDSQRDLTTQLEATLGLGENDQF